MVHNIVSMPSTFVTDDGLNLEIEFETDTGEKLKLGFSTDRFEQLFNRAAELVAHARSSTLSPSDHLVVHAVEVEDVIAEPASGGGKVILSVKGNKGAIQHFALTSDKAEALRPMLFRAARSAKKQASQSRH